MYVIGKNPCKQCREHGRDLSGDNFYWYGDDDGGHCYSCGYTVPSKDYMEEVSGLSGGFGNYSNKRFEERKGLTILEKDVQKFNENKLTPEQLEEIHNRTDDTLHCKYRGMDADICKEYGVRWTYHNDGKVKEMYFPAKYLVDGNEVITGYKVRTAPNKGFYSIGYVGKMNLMGGQTSQVADTLIVVAGEIDYLSALYILPRVRKYNKSVNIVTSLVGENTTADCLRNNFEWVDKHKKIIIAMDNDDAGEIAFEKCKELIDNNKLFKANLKFNDINDYFRNKKEGDLEKDIYWDALAIESLGLIGSRSLLSKALEIVNMERIPLPPFLSGLDEVFRGGIGLQEIVNIVSSVSTGKSVFVNEIILHWIMHSPYKMLIVSLEDNAGSYGAKIASRIIGEKIMGMRTPEERTKALLDNKDEIENFLVTESGEDRFILMEDATSDLDTMRKAIVQAIKVYGVKVIFIDPLQSLIGSKSLEDQVKWMEFEEESRRIYGVTFVNIAHTRKSGSGEQAHSEGGAISEEMIKGSQQISASATTNIILRRNKVAEDAIERNTTYVDITKNRTVGITGKELAKIYYSNDHHMLFDFDYAKSNDFFTGLTSEQLFNVMDSNKSSPVTSSLTDVEEDTVLEDF